MSRCIFVLVIFFTSQLAVAKNYEFFECAYTDPQNLRDAQFLLRGELNVEDDTKATLDYRSTMVLGPDSPYNFRAPELLISFSSGKVENDPKYRGRKYKNHFRFKLEWKAVSDGIDQADLIVSREPVSTERDRYSAYIDVFDAVLDTSYNDHHGDYIKLRCTHRYFKD